MKFKILIILVIAVFVGSCSDKKQTAYSNEAGLRGIQVAKEIVEHCDTTRLALEGMIIETVAIKSEYLKKGDTVAAKSFQKSFEEYIKKKNKHQKQQPTTKLAT